MKSKFFFLLLLTIATTARSQPLGEPALNWFSTKVLRNHVGCEPPPYMKSEVESIEELSSDLEKIKKSTKKPNGYDHCLAAEKTYEMTYRLKESVGENSVEQALTMAMETINEFETKGDFDNAIERALEFLRLFEFSNNDSDSRSEALRFAVLEASDQKIRLAGSNVDDNMTKAVLDYPEGISEILTSSDYRYFSYNKFLNDFPNGKYTQSVMKMLEFSVDSEIARQMDVAETYDKMSSSGTFGAGSARARLIGVYSIAGADQSKLLPEVICRNVEEDQKVIQRIQKLQSKGEHLSQSDRETLDKMFAQFHLLFEDGSKDPQMIIDYLRNTEFPKLKLLMKTIPNDQEWLDQFNSLF
jgi:hypothetical protein